MSVYDWTEKKVDELGCDLAETLHTAHDEALLTELAEWLNQSTVPEVRVALRFLAERISDTP